LIEEGDRYHESALAWQRRVVAEHAFLITTEAILCEVLNYFAVPAARGRAMQFYRGCRGRSEIGVEDFDPAMQQAAVKLYEERADKAWGITDCLSFVTMQHRGINDALTADHHFEQAGFAALLLTEPNP
jgi:predicted nucleic acid-binding protein